MKSNNINNNIVLNNINTNHLILQMIKSSYCYFCNNKNFVKSKQFIYIYNMITNNILNVKNIDNF